MKIETKENIMGTMEEKMLIFKMALPMIFSVLVSSLYNIVDGTVMESWFPLGGRGNTRDLFNDPTIKSIADAHKKTSAQVLLRWHLQANNIAIPGSSNPAHILENYQIFDFELTSDEMEKMKSLDKNKRFANY